MRRLSFAAALAASVLATARPSEAARRYAIVIGVNRPATGDLKPLNYADDDAVRTWEIFASVPGQASLFSVLDAETQRLYPEAARAAEVPAKDAIVARARDYFARMTADRARGETTELYFVFSGHGALDGQGQGRLELGDGVLSRNELYGSIIEASTADLNHLIIDACNAYFVVNSRGAPDLERLLRSHAEEFLTRDSLARHPNTGALLSTSGAAESHEWSAVQGGVFSHLLRTALLGGADADGDGRVSYLEVQAFLASASARIRNVKARLNVFAQPPARDLEHPLFEPAATGGAVLVLDAERTGRISVEDERGVRYADLNKSPEREVRLALLGRERLYVTTPAGEYAIEPKGEVRLPAQPSDTPRASARGGVGDALDKDLLAVPFGPSFYEGWRARNELALELQSTAKRAEPRPLRTASLWTAGAAVLAASVGTAFAIASSSSYADYQTAATPDQLASARRTTASRDQAANLSFGIAAGLAATAGGLLVGDLATH